MPAHDVTVTGSFSINSYTLTYMVDGEVYKSMTVVYGTAITPEKEPTKEGYTFSGWSEIPKTMPANDVVVTGSFSINSYTLTYMLDGEVYKTESIVYGTAITPEPAPIKEGHTFSGWTGLPATMPAHDVTVIGSFNINSYTLTFMVDGKVYASYSLVYGSTLPSVTAPTKEGHTFVGWGGLPTTMPAHDVMVQAQWIINQYQITYIVDGKVYKSYEIDYHAAITPEPAPIRKGMTFSGWNNLPEIMPARDITISGTFAWTKKTIGYVIYQVTDTLNNYVSVVGNNITSYSNVEAEILSSVEIEGESYKVNGIDNSSFNNRYYCLTSIIIPSSVTSIGDNAFYECNNVQFYVSRASYALVYVWNHFNTDPYEIGTGTMLTRPSLSALSTTQTSITYQINNFYPKLEYEYMGEAVGENTYMIKGLRPDYTLTVPLKVLYADNSFSTSAYITTSPIDPKVVSKRITASSLTVGGSYTEGDAKVVSTTLTMDGRQMAENEGSIHGLKPNTSYTCKYSVVVEYGDGETYTYNGSSGIRTASLTFTTNQPKVISVGNVIVSAESNLDDEETNIGFEWRRIDWTDDFASNSGTAYLYEGKMEGYIRNLYAEKLWKYRPYYESDSGNRYYGNWVGIDPTNTSFFEPTVHTYAQINVTGNTAEVMGYAMRGTDNVVSQGFMYWEGNTSVSLRRRAASVPDGAMVVNAKGNIMTATLKDLEYETTYNYVAFVTTSEGETFYGEMRTFSTSADPDGIEGVRASEEVVGKWLAMTFKAAR